MYFFSGTGMTKYVVDRLSAEFERHHLSVDCFKIEDASMHHVTLSEYDALGIAYPTHALNAPKIVINFVKSLPQSNDMNTFIVHTCSSENHRANHASSNLLIKKLSKRGYRVFNNQLIEMPSNFAHKDSEAEVINTLKRADKRIPHIAKSVVALKSHLANNSFSSKKVLPFLARIQWLGAPIT